MAPRSSKSILDEDDFLRGGMRGPQNGPTMSSKAVKSKYASLGGNKPKTASAASISSLKKKFAVIRVGKLKTMSKLAVAVDHNSRDRETFNADPERLDDNELLWGAESSQDVLEAWRERAPEKVRSNAVHALEYVISASPAALEAMSHEEQSQYFKDSLGFLATKHGAENILSAVVHRDEQTPHLQALVIPLDDKGGLNAREHVGGSQKLRELQGDFADLVAEPYGLERGRERSVARHKPIKEYYAEVQEKPDISRERLKEAIPTRDTGSVLKRGETDEAYADRVAEAMMDVVTKNLAPMKQQLNELETQNRQLEADLDAVMYLANTVRFTTLAAIEPDVRKAQKHLKTAHTRNADNKMDPSYQDSVRKTISGVSKARGLPNPENEVKVEREKPVKPKERERKRPVKREPSRDDDYDR